MQEKDIVNDALASLKSSITGYANVITECDNAQLRQFIVETRNKCEQSQYQLYQMAKQKGYYQPAPQANENEVQQLRTQLSQG